MICPGCHQQANKISDSNNWFCFRCQHEIKGLKVKLKTQPDPTYPKPKKKAKYRNVRTMIDGIWFDSKLEARYYNDLKLRLAAGGIAGFSYKAKFILTPEAEGMRKSEYITDFIIFHNDNTYEIIDTKGVRTKEYILKMKYMKDKYPKIIVNEVYIKK